MDRMLVQLDISERSALSREADQRDQISCRIREEFFSLEREFNNLELSDLNLVFFTKEAEIPRMFQRSDQEVVFQVL